MKKSVPISNMLSLLRCVDLSNRFSLNINYPAFYILAIANKEVHYRDKFANIMTIL